MERPDVPTLAGESPLTATRNCPRRVGLLLLCGLVSFLVSSAADLQGKSDPPPLSGEQDDQQWLGWRGLEKDGRLLTTNQYPLNWSEDKNVKWKTALPGQGYSSPIIHGDHVFVTAAYETVQGRSLKQGARYAMLLLLLIIVVATHHVSVSYCRSAPTSLRTALHLLALDLAVLLLSGFVLFGENVLAYTGSGDVRSWLSSGVGVSLCLFLASSYASLTGRRRILTGAAMISFAILFVVSTPMPTRKLLFEGTLFEEPFSNDTLVVFALPIALLLAAIWQILWHHLKKGRVPEEPRGGSLPQRLLLLKGTLILLFALGALGIGLGVRTSDYLAHHVAGQVDPTPVLGWWSVSTFAALYLFSVLYFALRGVVPKKLDNSLRLVFGVCVSALGLLLFATINFLSVQAQLTRSILSLDRHSGEIRWLSEGLSGPLGTMNTFNSPATPTPVVDGESIYAFFGSTGLFSSDMDGNVQWKRSDLPYENVYGAVVSPVVSDGVLVLVSDTPEAPYLTAIDATTGKRLWSRERDNRGFGFNGVNRTPLIREVNGRQLIFVWGSRYLRVYDLLSGEEIRQRKLRLGTADKVASPVSDGRNIYLAGTKKTAALNMEALAAGEESLVWTSETLVGPNCASPVLANGLLFMISDWGVLTCLDAHSGEKLWEEELMGEFYSSPVALGNHLYVSSTAGVTTVVAAERTYRLLGRAQLPEKILASFAATSGDLLVRTASHLYCLRQEAAG
jgi:outer membrane protein assembly factor BamB